MKKEYDIVFASYAKPIRYIAGFNKIKPFVGVHWEEDIVYTSMSILNKRKKELPPKAYIYCQNNLLKVYVEGMGGAYRCLGGFFSCLSYKEKAQFTENVDEIRRSLSKYCSNFKEAIYG